MSFFDKHETAFMVVSVIFVLAVIFGCQAGISLAVYHWVDRPGQEVDGRWFTVGAFVFWSLTTSINHNRSIDKTNRRL